MNQVSRERIARRTYCCVILLWWLPGATSLLCWLIDDFFYPSDVLQWLAGILMIWFAIAHLYILLLGPHINARILAREHEQLAKLRDSECPEGYSIMPLVYLFFAVPCAMAMFLLSDRLIFALPISPFASHALIIILGPTIAAFAFMLRRRVAALLHMTSMGLAASFFVWVLYLADSATHPVVLLPLLGVFLASLGVSLQTINMYDAPERDLHSDVNVTND